MASRNRALSFEPDARVRAALDAPLEDPTPDAPRLRVDPTKLPEWNMRRVPANSRRADRDDNITASHQE